MPLPAQPWRLRIERGRAAAGASSAPGRFVIPAGQPASGPSGRGRTGRRETARRSTSGRFASRRRHGTRGCRRGPSPAARPAPARSPCRQGVKHRPATRRCSNAARLPTEHRRPSQRAQDANPDLSWPPRRSNSATSRSHRHVAAPMCAASSPISRSIASSASSLGSVPDTPSPVAAPIPGVPVC